MTLAKPREHALSKKLRRAADKAPEPACSVYRGAAARLDQTIQSLGIWKDPERIKGTQAYAEAWRQMGKAERAGHA